MKNSSWPEKEELIYELLYLYQKKKDYVIEREHLVKIRNRLNKIKSIADSFGPKLFTKNAVTSVTTSKKAISL